jgi:hypothetical protein
VLELPESGWSIIVGHKRKSVRVSFMRRIQRADGYQDPLRAVLPLPLHTTALQPSSLKSIFASLSSLRITSLPEPVPPLVPDIDELRRRIARDRGETDDPGGTSGVAEEGEANETLDREMIYVAIVTSDSTVVYYKLSKGIKKPADIPDE